MKFFGHPLHIMFIHFPSALLPMELACYFLNYYTGKATFAEAAFYALAGAVLLGWPAIALGALDLVKIPEEKPEIMKAALLHGSVNTVIIIVYTVIAFSAYKTFPDVPGANITLLIIKMLLVGLLFSGNYIGGNLILKHRIGIENNQEK